MLCGFAVCVLVAGAIYSVRAKVRLDGLGKSPALSE